MSTQLTLADLPRIMAEADRSRILRVTSEPGIGRSHALRDAAKELAGDQVVIVDTYLGVPPYVATTLQMWEQGQELADAKVIIFDTDLFVDEQVIDAIIDLARTRTVTPIGKFDNEQTLALRDDVLIIVSETTLTNSRSELPLNFLSAMLTYSFTR